MIRALVPLLVLTACSTASPEPVSFECTPVGVDLPDGGSVGCSNIAPFCPPVSCADASGHVVCNALMATCPPAGSSPSGIISTESIDWQPERLPDGGWTYDCMIPICGEPACPPGRVPSTHEGQPCP